MIDVSKLPDLSWRPAAIPKKSGGKRFLLIPNDQLKEVQRNILQELYKHKELRISGNAWGFIPYRNINGGAAQHFKEARLIINMDVHNFFPSFPVRNIKEALMKSEFSMAEIEYIMQTCVYHGKKGEQCPQGAPTSPYLTNIGMFEVDCILRAFAKNCGMTYTRYADDMTFATKKGVSDLNATYFIKGVETILVRRLGLEISKKKTVVSYINSPRCPRRVTGVTIRKDGKGYNAKRATRQKARMQCHILYKKLLSGVKKEDLYRDYKSLYGLVAFCDRCRSYSEEGYNDADPSIKVEEWDYIQEVFNGH